MSNRIKVSFNGHDLTEYLSVTSLDRGVAIGRSSSTRNRRNKKGVVFLGTESSLVTFPMDFLMKGDLRKKRKSLMEILNVSEPKPLIFSDEPSFVYYAFPTGNISISENNLLGTGTILWEIPVGMKYSVADYTYSNFNPSGNPHDYIIVNNPGNEPMELELEVEFRSDNGFIGIEGENGSKALFGDISEVNQVKKKFSETLFNDHMYANRGWTANNGKVPPVTSNPRQQGTMSYRLESPGEGYAYPTNYGTVVETDWHGPSITKTVPADSEGNYAKNWECNFRIDFNPDGSGTAAPYQVGHQSMTFLDQNNNIIGSIVFEDNNETAAKSDFVVYVGNKRAWDKRNTNDYYITARPGEGFHVFVERYEKMFQVNLKSGANSKDNINPDTGKPYPQQQIQLFTDTNTQELRKITFYTAKYQAYPAMNNNLLRAINVVKHNVEKWVDVPNKFKDGDILHYGKEGLHHVVTLNSINNLELRDPGSTTLIAPPGTSIFYIAYSDFSLPPNVELKGRARFTI